MKEILPIIVWLDGEENTAQYLQVTGTYDNYLSTATVFYQLFQMFVDSQGNKSPSQQLASGYKIISGQDYLDWGDVPAMGVNAWIYNWTAQQINVTIIP